MNFDSEWKDKLCIIMLDFVFRCVVLQKSLIRFQKLITPVVIMRNCTLTFILLCWIFIEVLSVVCITIWRILLIYNLKGRIFLMMDFRRLEPNGVLLQGALELEDSRSSVMHPAMSPRMQRVFCFCLLKYNIIRKTVPKTVSSP